MRASVAPESTGFSVYSDRLLPDAPEGYKWVLSRADFGVEGTKEHVITIAIGDHDGVGLTEFPIPSDETVWKNPSVVVGAVPGDGAGFHSVSLDEVETVKSVWVVGFNNSSTTNSAYVAVEYKAVKVTMDEYRKLAAQV